MKLRPIAMGDFDAISQLWEETGMGASPREKFRSAVRRDGELFLAAELKGRIIGTVLGVWDGWRGSIWRLAVHPEYQRRGVAQKLLKEIEKRLRDKGATWIFLITGADNKPAKALYHASGYEYADFLHIIHKSVPPKQAVKKPKKAKKGCPEE